MNKDRIVCLDGYTLNPGDLSWEQIEALGSFSCHDRTPAKQIFARSAGVKYLLTNKTPLDEQMIGQLPDLQYIGVLATGYNIVNIEAAAARGIAVTNIPTYGTDTVAQHATGLMLELSRGIGMHGTAVREGRWTSCDDWCFSLAPITELTGKTLGILGLGRIGRTLARIGAAMGMKLIGHDVYWPTPEQFEGLEVERVDVDDVFRRADVLSLHCPLTDETNRIVNAERLGLMKSTAILINTSRGPLVDEQALADALRAGKIAGAGLDVLLEEPPPASNPLLNAPNCIVTPHIAWYAKEARQRMMDTAAENLRAFIGGNPVNKVN